MRIVILTGSRKGTASYCLQQLLLHTKVQVVLVIYSEGVVTNKWKYYKRKFRKVVKIGFLGALNGIRMRNWYRLPDDGTILIEDLRSICERENIQFVSTPVINDEATAGLIRSVNPDLGLSLGNSYISRKIFTIPQFGMLNIHGEVLPQFQNAQSVIWQLYEGSKETGYTIHKIDSKIDTGEILIQEKFPIKFEETLAATVRRTSTEILKRAASGLVRVLNNFDEFYQNAWPQGKGKSYTTPGFFEFMTIHKNFKKIKKEAENRSQDIQLK